METTVGWVLAWIGLGLGALLVPIPGVPGALVAWLGLMGFAAATGFDLLGRDALALMALLAWFGLVAQALSPLWAAWGGSRSVGALSGALAAGVVALWIPVPLVSILLGIVGAVVGGLVGRGRWLDGLVKVPMSGCSALVLAVALDGVAVLTQAAVFAVMVWGAGVG